MTVHIHPNFSITRITPDKEVDPVSMTPAQPTAAATSAAVAA
ncbi:hypothetical protein BJQ94_01830 [Cryobacterium sp. SO2]|nr:hypothetical protein [Cryobacterium sp. SO2]WEO77811.1 hypothetical protein BJQ94_01830 [Cryobacterium sp. SO2]